MSIPYVNYSDWNHTGIIIGSQQSIQRRMNLRPDWNEIRCVAMARLVGGTTIDNGIGSLHLATSDNTLINNVTLPIHKFYFGIKDSSLNYPETQNSKFIGVGVGSRPNLTAQYISGWNGTSAFSQPGSSNATSGVRYYDAAQSGMMYGVSVGNTTASVLKAMTTASAPNHRFQPVPNRSMGTPTTLFCSSVGFMIRVENRGTEDQKVSIHNYGSETAVSNVTSLRTFSSLSESILDQELNIIGSNFFAHSGGLTHTFDVPHSQFDLSGIDSFYIHWPFAVNRLILFNLKIKDYTL